MVLKANKPFLKNVRVVPHFTAVNLKKTFYNIVVYKIKAAKVPKRPLKAPYS